ncbi:hypothetical protein Zmor_021855 [Zophobas morio]|uniref:Uncharacterized protein n=1 Tax=Zophobas morio TaxID=2755281 RepID=A0AA38I671_9CUCU|nr:hypothetical protein Zmor_021855 [Zophobas morio]
MGSSKHGDDDSSCGVRLAERRSLKKGLEAEVATDSRKTSITKPLEGDCVYHYILLDSKVFHLPCKRTLLRITEKLKFSPGLQDVMFDILLRLIT